MEPRSNDMQDAIDRYLDNASSLDETRELFDAIAKDASVRQDFQSAALMRDTFDQELTTTVMPADLYGTIVEQARREGTLPLVPSAVPSTRLWLGMGAVGILILGGVAAGVLPWQDAGRDQEMVGQGPAGLSVRTDRATSFSKSDGTPASPSSPTIAVQGPPPSAPRHSRGADAWSGGRTFGYRTASTSDTRRLPSAMADDPASVGPISADVASTVDADVQATEDLRTIAYTSPSTIAIPPVTIDEPLAQRYRAIGAAASYGMPSVSLRMVSVPVNAYSYLPGAQVNGSWAVEAEYRLDDVHAIGVGVHNDVMTMNVIGSDGTQRAEERMLWSSVHWRATMPIEIVDGVRPWFQLAAGGSSRGAVVEPTIGAGTTFGAMSFSVGASLQGFVYQGVDAVRTATRTSLRVEVGYHWE